MSNERKLMDFFFITNGESSTHYHQNIEIIYLVSGRMEIRIDDEQYDLRDDDFVLINANKRHSVNAKSEIFGVRFVIDYHLLSEYMGTMQLFFWCNTVVDKNDGYDEMRQLMNQIMDRHFERNEKGSLYLNSLYYQLLYLLTSNFMIHADDVRMKIANSQDRKRIVQIQNYIQANYQKQVSLNDLAEQMYLSNAYLSKYIKKHMGMNFMDYLNNIRFFHAVDELLYSSKSLTRIAMDNGFPSSSAFTKIFRSIHQEAPIEYRKRIKKEQALSEDSGMDEALSEQIIYDYLHKQHKPGTVPETDEIEVLADSGKWKAAGHVPCQAINIGPAASILDSDVQKQLLKLKQEAGIRYVRIWNILDFDISKRETAVYNFRQLDRVLDFLVDNGIKPYLELGKKPKYIFNSPDDVIYEEQQSEQLFNFAEFEPMMEALSSHLAGRYGIEAVEEWYFEFWNNPLLEMEEEAGAWYDYFACICRSLHGLSPAISVGGAGFVLGVDQEKNRRLLRIWKQKEYQPDFISVYSYQYITVYQDDTPYGRKSVDSSYICNQIEIFRKIMAAEQFTATRLHLTEWNFTISNRNMINDSCEQGAYILKNCLELLGQMDMYCYWHGLDSYSEFKDSATILNGDSGLISKDGIRKPGFYAYSMVNKLCRNVICKCDNGIVTFDGRSGYTIACHNFKKLSWKYVVTEENMISSKSLDNYFEDTKVQTIRWHLKNIKDGRYLIKSTYVNPEHGSVLDMWNRLDCLPALGVKEIGYLKEMCRPGEVMELVTVTDGTMMIECNLAAQEIRLIEIFYV